MEVRARCQLSHLGLLVVEDLYIFLGRWWLKRRHQACYTGNLSHVLLAASVEKLWSKHVTRTPKETDLATALVSVGLKLRLFWVLRYNLGVFRDDEVLNLSSTVDSDTIVEVVVEDSSFVKTVTAVVREQGQRYLKVVRAIHDLHLDQKTRLQSHFLAWLEISQLDCHRVLFLVVLLRQDSRLSSGYGIFVVLDGLLFIADYRFDSHAIELRCQLCEQSLLL